MRNYKYTVPMRDRNLSEDESSTWWLYLLACKDGRTYAGIALDVRERFRNHLTGKASKFTRSNPPIAILGMQPFASKPEALRAEWQLKCLEKPAKLAWARRHPAPENAEPIFPPEVVTEIASAG